MAGAFRATIGAVPVELQERMRGRSWRPDLAPPFAQLALVSLSFRNFIGNEGHGEMVVHTSIADPVVEVFRALYAGGFAIERIEEMHAYDGDDDRAMAANNTHCFNARTIRGTTRPSRHALGLAIDLNPAQNPAIREGVIRPPTAAAYLDRDDLRPGMIDEGVVALFAEHGFAWGGHWHEPRDYHHFYVPDD